jgi:hypothetical protein
MNTPAIQDQGLSRYFLRLRFRRGIAFGAIIIAALLAFEIFNYSTTDFALTDLLGDLRFLGIRWATVLALAFCGMDFAGIARLFTPEESSGEINEVWYLFGAWLLAATMNAMLTWWGVSIAIINHASLGNAVLSRDTVLKAVPIFVAIMVWLIRVLIIGAFSMAGDRLFSQADQRSYARSRQAFSSRLTRDQRSTAGSAIPSRGNTSPATSFRPAPKPLASSDGGFSRVEPTYSSLSISASPPTQASGRVRR